MSLSFRAVREALPMSVREELKKASVAEMRRGLSNRVFNAPAKNSLLDQDTFSTISAGFNQLLNQAELIIILEEDGFSHACFNGEDSGKVKAWFEALVPLAVGMLLDGRGNLQADVLHELGCSTESAVYGLEDIINILCSYIQGLWELCRESIELVDKSKIHHLLPAIGKIKTNFSGLIQEELFKQKNLLMCLKKKNGSIDENLEKLIKEYVVQSIQHEMPDFADEMVLLTDEKDWLEGLKNSLAKTEAQDRKMIVLPKYIAMVEYYREALPKLNCKIDEAKSVEAKSAVPRSSSADLLATLRRTPSPSSSESGEMSQANAFSNKTSVFKRFLAEVRSKPLLTQEQQERLKYWLTHSGPAPRT